MAKAKERLDAEAKLNMTKKQKWDNFWFYYKMHVIAGTIGVILVGFFIYDMMSQVENDYTIGLITPYGLTQETLLEMQDAITTIADDRNEDGEVHVALSHYQLSNDPQGDPMTQMAATTRLSGDISVNASMIYIIDTPDDYLHVITGMFPYNDGSAVAETGAVDIENLGYAASEISIFDEVSYIQAIENARVVMVDNNISKIQKDEELLDYYDDSKILYEKMLG